MSADHHKPVSETMYHRHVIATRPPRQASYGRPKTVKLLKLRITWPSGTDGATRAAHVWCTRSHWASLAWYFPTNRRQRHVQALMARYLQSDCL